MRLWPNTHTHTHRRSLRTCVPVCLFACLPLTSCYKGQDASAQLFCTWKGAARIICEMETLDPKRSLERKAQINSTRAWRHKQTCIPVLWSCCAVRCANHVCVSQKNIHVKLGCHARIVGGRGEYHQEDRIVYLHSVSPLSHHPLPL